MILQFCNSSSALQVIRKFILALEFPRFFSFSQKRPFVTMNRSGTRLDHGDASFTMFSSSLNHSYRSFGEFRSMKIIEFIDGAALQYSRSM